MEIAERPSSLSSFSLDGDQMNLVSSIVGPVEEFEEKMLADGSSDTDIFYKSCLDIAGQQTSIPRAVKWLRVATEGRNRDAGVLLAALIHASNRDLEYKGDEAALLLRLDERKKKIKIFDPTGSRAYRGLIRTLLSGSLSKNQDSVLYKSFFCSSMRETRLLPIISKYTIKMVKEGDNIENEHEFSRPFSRILSNTTSYLSSTHIHLSLLEIGYLLLEDPSHLSHVCVSINSTYKHISPFPSLSLLLSYLPPLRNIAITGNPHPSVGHRPEINLSVLNRVNTSKLKILELEECFINSLSPLSLFDLSSLTCLELGCELGSIRGLQSLEGLTSKETKALSILRIHCPDLVDISALSDCDLSFLEVLSFKFCSSHSDLSPLEHCDLSRLKEMVLTKSGVNNLSQLPKNGTLNLDVVKF